MRDKTNEKIIDDAETELQRRRDRGKVAQRAFRHRQSEAIQKLKEDHERLKSLVTEIIESAKVDNQAQLQAAIIKAGNVVGLDITDLSAEDVQQLNDSPKKSSKTVQPVVELSSDQGSFVNASATQVSSVEPNTLQLYHGQTPQNSYHQVGRSASQYYGQSGRMSPRFDYGFWLDPDHFIKIFQPPHDLEPYLGARRYTIAGQITWASVDYAYDRLRGSLGKQNMVNPTSPSQVGDQYPRSLPPNSAARAYFDLSLRHSKPLHDVTYLAELMDAHLEFRQFGYMRGDKPGANMESYQTLRRRVLDDISNRRIKKDQWWSAMEIEFHIQKKMGAREFAAFQASVTREEDAHMQILKPFIQALAQSGICFGDGSRWNAHDIMTTVDTWLYAVRQFQIGEDGFSNVTSDEIT